MESRRSSASYAEPPAAAICAGEIQNGLVQQQDQYRLETNRKLSKRRNRLPDDVNTVQQSHRFGGVSFQLPIASYDDWRANINIDRPILWESH